MKQMKIIHGDGYSGQELESFKVRDLEAKYVNEFRMLLFLNSPSSLAI